MEHGDVTRLLNVADADVHHFVVNDNSVSVVLAGGVERLWTPDGVFAVNDCPQNRSLRPVPEELKHEATAGEDELIEPAEEKLAEPGEVEQVPPAETSAEEVPDGTAAEVLAWVDGDPDRAALAITAEEQREKPRSVLLGELRKAVKS